MEPSLGGAPTDNMAGAVVGTNLLEACARRLGDLLSMERVELRDRQVCLAVPGHSMALFGCSHDLAVIFELDTGSSGWLLVTGFSQLRSLSVLEVYFIPSGLP